MTRRLNEVINRAEVAKAAVLALPKMPKASLAKSLGISRGQLTYYLSGRFKPYVPPEWARTLFLASASLNFGDLSKAAEGFRNLAKQLEDFERTTKSI